jgi:hypothetical protein
MLVGFRTGVSAGDLPAVIPQTHTPDYQFMILHNAGALCFDRYNDKITWADWEQGVLFGDKAELRFRRRRGGSYHLVLITDNATLPAGFVSAGTAVALRAEEGDTGAKVTETVYLWGEWDAKEKAWIEGRIPRRLNYPVTPPGKKGRAVLLMEQLAFTPALGFAGAPDRMLERLCGLKVDEG